MGSEFMAARGREGEEGFFSSEEEEELITWTAPLGLLEIKGKRRKSLSPSSLDQSTLGKPAAKNPR